MPLSHFLEQELITLSHYLQTPLPGLNDPLLLCLPHSCPTFFHTSLQQKCTHHLVSLSNTSHLGCLHPFLAPLFLHLEQPLSLPHPSSLHHHSRYKSGFPSPVKLFLTTPITSSLSLILLNVHSAQSCPHHHCKFLVVYCHVSLYNCFLRIGIAPSTRFS